MNKLLEVIEKEDIIALFRHVNPDGDALGSQYGIAQYIKDNYPEKTVYLFGDREENLSYYPYDEIEGTQEMLSEAFGIIVDTANVQRIDGPYQWVKGILNLDHHPQDEPYGNLVINKSDRASTCEIVAEFLLEGKEVSAKTASYLLSGILTDTVRFSVEATKPQTLRVAANLMEKGANITELNQIFFTKRYEDFNYERIFAQKVEYENGLASLIISKALREKYELSDRDAKQYAIVMYNVKEFEINVVFVESDDGSYIGSLRSKQITINQLASQYRGGGHRLAAGFKAKDKKEVDEIKTKLIALINQLEDIN